MISLTYGSNQLRGNSPLNLSLVTILFGCATANAESPSVFQKQMENLDQRMKKAQNAEINLKKAQNDTINLQYGVFEVELVPKTTSDPSPLRTSTGSPSDPTTKTQTQGAAASDGTSQKSKSNDEPTQKYHKSVNVDTFEKFVKAYGYTPKHEIVSGKGETRVVMQLTVSEIKALLKMIRENDKFADTRDDHKLDVLENSFKIVERPEYNNYKSVEDIPVDEAKVLLEIFREYEAYDDLPFLKRVEERLEHHKQGSGTPETKSSEPNFTLLAELDLDLLNALKKRQGSQRVTAELDLEETEALKTVLEAAQIAKKLRASIQEKAVGRPAANVPAVDKAPPHRTGGRRLIYEHTRAKSV